MEEEKNGNGEVKKKKVNVKILASMPRNAKEEEDKFFKSNCTVNP